MPFSRFAPGARQAFPQAARPSCWRVVANKFLVPVWLCALPIMMPTPALADITVTGKTSSTIKAYVKPLEFIEVTNELGWQDNLVMQQLGGWTTPYEVALRLRVTSLPNKFQARLDAPLVLQNAKNQVFRQPVVTLGTDLRRGQAATGGPERRIRKSEAVRRGANSVGMYELKVAALPPRAISATSRVRTRGVVDDARSGRYQALSTVLQTAGVCRGHAGQHV